MEEETGINDKTMNMLEYRLKKLEDKVQGNLDDLDVYSSKDDIITTLASLGGKLGNALSTRDRMMMVMKRSEELERYMDPSYGDADLSDSVKADLILAQEENLHSQYQQLSSLNSMKQCLSSQTIAESVTAQKVEMGDIWNKYADTEKLTKEQSEQIAEMLENYNSIIMTLTETFIRMDDIVTKAEISAMPQKNRD